MITCTIAMDEEFINLKKAIQYIISIHIPIILVVFIPLALAGFYQYIFARSCNLSW
jgi:Ca2+-transporting ATPase